MSTLSCHALDTSTGRPADNLKLMLEKQPDAAAWKQYCQDRFNTESSEKPRWEALGKGTSNSDGRCPDLLPAGTQLQPGLYRMSFDTASYFDSHNQTGFYPLVQIVFEIQAEDEHYHIPLLLSPYGYSTYRGS